LGAAEKTLGSLETCKAVGVDLPSVASDITGNGAAISLLCGSAISTRSNASFSEKVLPACYSWPVPRRCASKVAHHPTPPPLLWRSAALLASSHDAGALTRSSMGEQRLAAAGVVGHGAPSSVWRVGAFSPPASRTRRSACSSRAMRIGCSQSLSFGLRL
jgi:hypothetical protein